jgi:acetyltransferase-like isoleucine patch superfamily enzyme
MINPLPEHIRLIGRSARELRWRVSDPRVTIGRGTYGDPRIILYSGEDRASIGNFCSIAGGSTLLAGGEHQYKTTSTFPFNYYTLDDPGAEETDPMKIRFADARHKGPLRLGSDVWVGYNALILSGVTIGHGAVIGAGAVVAKDVPPYSIAVGSPCQIAKKRFDDHTIDSLLKIRWWDWNLAAILRYKPLLLGDPKDFLEAVSRLDARELDSYREVDPEDDRMLYEEIPIPIPIPISIPKDSIVKRGISALTPPIAYRALRRIIRG